MRVTLTFDNGPTPGVTNAVLDVLKARGIAASFFVVGNQLRRPGARALAERAAAEGHWIGNHTLTHKVVFGEDGDTATVAREIGETEDILGALAHPDRLFRPNGRGRFGNHLLSAEAVRYLCANRYSCVLWTSVPRDWEADAAWVDRCLDDVMRDDWSVVVVHDLPTGAMALLPRLLDRLEKSGAEFRQDYPPACVPIVRGEILRPLDDILKLPDQEVI